MDYVYDWSKKSSKKVEEPSKEIKQEKQLHPVSSQQ